MRHTRYSAAAKLYLAPVSMRVSVAAIFLSRRIGRRILIPRHAFVIWLQAGMDIRDVKRTEKVYIKTAQPPVWYLTVVKELIECLSLV